MQANEFPPISTFEAEMIRPASQGDAGFGTVGLVPKLENEGSGTELGNFYRRENLVRTGQPFLYRFVPREKK